MLHTRSPVGGLQLNKGMRYSDFKVKLNFEKHRRDSTYRVY